MAREQLIERVAVAFPRAGEQVQGPIGGRRAEGLALHLNRLR